MQETNWHRSHSRYAEFSSLHVVDPTVTGMGTLCVVRRGSWRVPSRGQRSAYRFGVGPGFRSFNLGFRLLSAAAPSSINCRIRAFKPGVAMS
jgi:formylglycine-generating enzyme required for sulfatase activity